MNNKSIKTNTRFRQTDKKRSIVIGVLLTIILTATPFLFYIYQFAPADSKQWETSLGTITASGFNSVQSFMHALFTKATFVLLLGMWFLTARNWWKYAILIPLTMFLFQLIGVLNVELEYIDEYDFWYSLPIILPIILFLILISFRLSRLHDISAALKDDIDDEIKKVLSDEL